MRRTCGTCCGCGLARDELPAARTCSSWRKGLGAVRRERDNLRRWMRWLDGRCAANDPKPYPLALLRAEIKSALAGMTVQQHVKRGCVPVDARAALRGKAAPRAIKGGAR